MSADVRFVANRGALGIIAKSGEVAGVLQRAATNGARGAGTYDGTTYAATVVGADASNDLAVLKIGLGLCSGDLWLQQRHECGRHGVCRGQPHG